MSFITDFESRLPETLRQPFQRLDTPFAIQQYLDSLPYKAEERDRSPLNVILDGQCHCLDGGLFAALALWRIGYAPLLADIVPDPGMDDDHVLALYKIEGRWGAVAKSNYVNLGFREAVYKNLRELTMSYFEHFASVTQVKTLRGYTRPFDASRCTHLNWAVDEAGATQLYRRFYQRKSIPLITPSMAARLNPIADRNYQAETLFTDLNWSFGIRPDEKHVP
jgi:hypothetical protein